MLQGEPLLVSPRQDVLA